MFTAITTFFSGAKVYLIGAACAVALALVLYGVYWVHKTDTTIANQAQTIVVQQTAVNNDNATIKILQADAEKQAQAIVTVTKEYDSEATNLAAVVNQNNKNTILLLTDPTGAATNYNNDFNQVNQCAAIDTGSNAKSLGLTTKEFTDAQTACSN